MIFKCKMCGGDIEPIASTNTGKCKYCKSVMTLPNSFDEKIVNLYNRANFLRISNEFDKAKEVYENILGIDNEQIEAHWGLILCKYGIEYVDDPKTKKKVPTCHRTYDYSIFTDKDYKIIKKEAYGDALELYEEEAKKIDEIQKNIISISSKEKPYDVFICYKETDENGERTNDSVLAEEIYEKLVEQNYKVFFSRITLENKLGIQYEPYIYSALKSSKVMLVVGSKEEFFNAVWVKNEWNRYIEMMKTDKGKVLIPVFSKIDVYQLPEEFTMLQAQSMDKVGAMQDLIRGVKKIVNEYKTEEIDGIDTETVAKVKAALDEVKMIGNGKYEVTIIKEKLPTWYYILCACAMACLLIVLLRIGFINSLYSFKHLSIVANHIRDFNLNFVRIFEVLYFLVIEGYILCLFLNRKTHKISKKYFYILLVLVCIRALLLLNNCIVPQDIKYFLVFFGIDILIIIISYLIKPRWNLDMASKSIMDSEYKDKQLKTNNEIKEGFTNYEKNHITKKYIFYSIIFVFVISILSIISIWNVFPYNQSNNEDRSINQIKILGNKNIYESATLESRVLASVRHGEYYDIVDFSEVKQNKNLTFYGFVKIKTNKGIEGYLYLGDYHEYDDYYPEKYDYMIMCSDDECSIKNGYSNKKDETVDQVLVTNETLNIRRDHSTSYSILVTVKKDDIFTVLDTYLEEIKESRWNDDFNSDSYGFYEVVVDKRTWYKVRTSNDIEGWICANVNGEVYLELIKAK